jgi:hypothetical protein
MRSLSILFIYITVGYFQSLIAQSVVEKGYFMFPIKPGQTNYLTGSMGELRANHFHAGIDVKTDGQIGLPVYCSADGYVSRIKISSYGYGKVLYITHPNGLTSVYAHLEKFDPILSAWTLKKQYELESFDIDINPNKDELLVKKGQVIATSGNTGSSGGPHLHYEIRDAEEKVLNPLLFNFREIKDTESPIIDFVALRSFGISSRVENEFGRKDFKPVKTGKNFIISKPISASGNIGIELKAHDRMNETYNQYGIACMELKVDGKEIFFHNINKFSFEDGKKINAHLDYETLLAKNQRFQHCYISDGNDLCSYKQCSHSGKLSIVPGQKYKIEVTVYDAYNNNSTLTFTIEGKESNYNIPSTEVSKGGYRVFENVLKIKGKEAKDTTADFYYQGKKMLIKPSYIINGLPVYLYDLRNGLLDSIVMEKYTEHIDFVKMVPPYQKVNFKCGNFQVELSDSALMDTVYMKMKCMKDANGNPQLNVHEPSVPIFGGYEISYSPGTNEILTPNSYIALNGKKYEESRFKGNNMFAQVKYFGKFVIVKDTAKPVVKYVTHNTKSIKFNIFDKESGIESFRATIDGKWVMMNYEHKKKLIWSENLDKNKPLKGKFILEVKDQAGNIKTFEKIL